VDNGNITHHKPGRGHDIPPGPGSEGRGDTKRVQGAGGGTRARRGGRIGLQRRSSRWGQRRGIRDKHREARSAASRRGGERGSSRGEGGVRGRGGEEAKGRLRRGVDTRPNFMYSFTPIHRETEEKACQPETTLGAIAQKRHIARLRNAKRSRIKHPKPTHGAQDRPKQPQPRAGLDRASGSGQRHASRRTRPTDTGTRCPGKGKR
jgi:hypothetical protein